MKVQIERDDLLHLLHPTQSLIEKRNIIPILSKILIQAKQDQLKLFVTDQENSLQCTFKVQNQKEGSACVDAQNFFSIIKELPSGSLFLEKPEKKEGLRIKTQSSNFNMVGTNPEDFPIFPSLKTPHYFFLESAQLTSLIHQTTYCVSMDETRYHLNGVLCEEREKFLRFVATDGHRLSYADQEKEGKLNIPQGVIIPKKGLQELSRLMGEEKKQVQIAIHPPRMLFQTGPFLLSIRLIEGQYPNYQQLIPTTSKIKVVVDREILIQALKRVSILSSLQSKNVLFQWGKKKLILSAKHPDLGDAKEEVPLIKSNGELEIRFNARYVMDSLCHLKEDVVTWEMQTEASPGIIQASKKGVCVIMPMKL